MDFTSIFFSAKSTRVICTCLREMKLQQFQILVPDFLSGPVWVLTVSLPLSLSPLDLHTAPGSRQGSLYLHSNLPVDLIPPLYYFVHSLGSLAFPRTFSALVRARASFWNRIMSCDTCRACPDIALMRFKLHLWNFIRQNNTRTDRILYETNVI